MPENNRLTPHKNKRKIQKIFGLQRTPDKILELTQYWSPPVPAWMPLKNKPNSNLRIAAIVGDRLYHGLRFEGELLLLTPENWKWVLKYGKPDLLLLESFWSTATGHWYMGQSISSLEKDRLLQIIALARKLSVPTVYWITKGHEYHEHYKDFALNFDYVFCADPREAEILSYDGVHTELLQPCIQPAIYNPFRFYEHYETFGLNILFDGWADLDRLGDQMNIFQEVKQHGLSIIDSRYQVFRNRLNVLPKYRECILGCVTEQSRILSLKYANSYVTSKQTLSTQITQQWMSLEAAASRLPVVHHGSLPENDVRKDIVIECSKDEEFLLEFIRFQKDDLYRERIAHLGWRNTHQSHTFAHRLKKICNTLKIAHEWQEYPKASIITPTYRPELLQRCIETVNCQIYPNKELIVVFNGNNVPSNEEFKLNKTRSDVKIVNVPSEMLAGACLNHGHQMATGDYCFRVDDDDNYGKHYIHDMMLHTRCMDINLFGKPPGPVYLEENKKTYVRSVTPSLCIVPFSILQDGKIWPGGNSISGKKKYFNSIQYNDLFFGAADSVFLLNLPAEKKGYFAIMDNFNLLVIRRLDKTTHTWKVNAEEFKINDTLDDISDVFV